MNIKNEPEACPICSDMKRMKTSKLLYEHRVCRKCYYGFANRRQISAIIDFLAWQIVVILPVGFAIGVCGALVLAFSGLSEVMIDNQVSLICNIFPYLIFPIFCLKDGFGGHSLGRAITGIQVIRYTSGLPISFKESFKRNIILIIPLMALVISSQLLGGKRIGDDWAKSRVIWKKHRDKIPFLVENAL